MNDREIINIIIALLHGVKPNEKMRLLEKVNHENDFDILLKENIEDFLNRKLKNYRYMDGIYEKAVKIAAVCRMRSIKFVSRLDSSYPFLLNEIHDPPPVLFYRGELPGYQKPLLAMAGTRHPSPEGANQAYMIARVMGQAGFSVISGLAFGIDAMSHRGNLDAGAPGYAVMGCGLDEIYPRGNRVLAKRILDSGGALISEYTPGTLPYKWNFPARNRIISGLAQSTLIVEAPQRSGARITAEFALDQDRDLWVASSGVREGHIKFDKRGTAKLAEDGAEIVYHARDVFEKWGFEVAYNEDAIHAETGGRRLAASLANNLDIEL